MIYKTKEGGSAYAMQADFREDKPLPLWIKHEIHHGRLSRTLSKGEQYFTIYTDNECKGIRAYHGMWIVKNKTSHLFCMANDDFNEAFDV